MNSLAMWPIWMFFFFPRWLKGEYAVDKLLDKLFDEWDDDTLSDLLS